MAKGRLTDLGYFPLQSEELNASRKRKIGYDARQQSQALNELVYGHCTDVLSPSQGVGERKSVQHSVPPSQRSCDEPPQINIVAEAKQRSAAERAPSKQHEEVPSVGAAFPESNTCGVKLPFVAAVPQTSPTPTKSLLGLSAQLEEQILSLIHI